jgi:hypothetical protein
MEFLAGTADGIYRTGSNDPLSGTPGSGFRQLARVDGCLLAGGTNGAYRSLDGGHTWRLSGLKDLDVWDVSPDPHEPRGVLAGTQPAHVFKSHDAGENWEPYDAFLQVPGAEQWCVPNNPQGARALTLLHDPFDPGRFLVGVEVGGVVASEDGGRNWTVSRPGDNGDVHVIRAHPTRAGTLFATTGYGRNDSQPVNPRMAGLYRSQDSGRSWQYLGDRMEPHYTRPICIDSREPFAITVPCAPDVRSSIKDPGGAQTVLFRSEDGGETWRSLGDAGHSPSAARLTAVSPDPAAQGSVLVGTETGEVWQVSSDAVWEKLAEGLPAVLSLMALD